MLIPPDAAAAQPPPSLACAAAAAANRRPEPLDPELEARLRRQRAQQYGRAVRDSMATWHARHAAKRQEEAAEKREQWEAQRAARLARLAAKQQQDQEQRAATPCPPPAPTGAARQGVPTLATLLQAAQELDAKLSIRPATCSPSRLHTIPATARRPQQQQQQQQKQQQHMWQRAPGPAQRHESSPSSAACSVAPPAGEQSEPPDPLSALLVQLLAAEGGGDPFSIVNLFVEEQLQLQQAASAVAARAPGPCCTAAATQPPEIGGSSPLRERPQPPVLQAGPPPVPTDAQLHAAASAAGAVAAGQQARSTTLGDLENVPANLRHHHRRSSSVLLPQFDAVGGHEAAAGEQQQPSGLAMPAVPASPRRPPPHLQAELQTAGNVMLQSPQQPLLSQQHQLQQRLQEPHSGAAGKQLYVQQWLQRSAADLAAEASPRPTSSAAYSADPERFGEAAASADLEALLPSPRYPAAAAAADHPQPHPDAAAPEEAAAAAPAAPAPDLAAAQATAVSSAPPSSSRSASVVTSSRRPGALPPPGSSSRPDGTTTLSASLDFGMGGQQLAGQTLETAGASPAGETLALEGQAAEEEWEAEKEQAAEEEQQAVNWDRCTCSSDGGRSQGSGTAASKLQQALSFAQLQEVAAAAQTAEDLAHADCSAEERSSHSPSSSCGSARQGGSVIAAAALQQELPVAMAALPPAEEGPQGSEAYSEEFDSEVEISYGQYGSSPASSPRVGAAGGVSQLALAPAPVPLVTSEAVEASAVSSRPTSPCLVLPRTGASPPGSASQQRPRSPYHAALDDRYPGSPPASPGSALQQTMPGLAGSSRPMSPASQTTSRRASAAGDGTSRPGSPNPALATAAAEPSGPQQEDTMVVHSPAASSGSSSATGRLLHVGGSPYAQLRFGSEPFADAEEQAAAAAAAEGGMGSPRSPEATGPAGAGSPPGTPVLVSPGSADDGSCPGSERVEDATVVQTEEHVRGYLSEVMLYFWAGRAEAYASGVVPPLDLDGYLAIERRRPACGDPQHIFNKLLFDAANEALLSHYNQALSSCTGRLAPRLALLSPQLVEQHVVQRVLRWAGMGGGGAGGGGTDLSVLLAEDALEEERALSVLTGAMAAELTAAAVAEGMDAEGSWEGEAPEGPDVVKATAQEQPRREDV